MRELEPFPLLNKNKKFILFTNAKCGGTLLKSWFLGTLDLEKTFSNFFTSISHFKLSFVLNWYCHYYKFYNGKQIISNDKYLRRFINDYRLSTKSMLPDVINSSDWFKFAVVRNPYDRLVSAFVDKFCGEDSREKWFQELGINSRDTHGNLEINFIQFVDYLSCQDNDTVNYHWRRQSFILDGVNLDRIIDIRQIAKELPEVENQIGVSRRIINFNIRRQSYFYSKEKYNGLSFVGNVSNNQLMEYYKKTNKFPAKSMFYNDILRSKVKKIYRDDFELYPWQGDIED